jgi:hypothetical protein
MRENPFARVREAISRDPESILRQFGVRHAKQGDGFALRGNWTSAFICPCCDDKGGSASFSREAFLKCHQCARKQDVFTWVAERDGKTPWEVCKELAEQLNVDISFKKPPKAKNLPARMTEGLTSAFSGALIEAPEAEGAREFLKSRGCWDEQVLVRAGVGFSQGSIIFSQLDAGGSIADRYRVYTPKALNPWRWNGRGRGGPGVWAILPNIPLDQIKGILCTEGEHDALAGACTLRLHERGWAIITFTSGAGACPPLHTLPAWMRGKTVYLAYDNDTWQGPDYANYHVELKKGKDPRALKAAARARLSNLLERVVPTLQQHGCKVEMMTCPISPREKWGADLRDWIQAGGRDLQEWKPTPVDELPSLAADIETVTVDELFQRPGQTVRVAVRVSATSGNDLTRKQVVKLDCKKDTAPACGDCPVKVEFPDFLATRDDPIYRDEWTRAEHEKALRDHLIKHVFTPPPGCPGARETLVEGTHGCRWIAEAPSGGDTPAVPRRFIVLSEEAPSLTGMIEVTGRVVTCQNEVMLEASNIRSIDLEMIPLEPIIGELRALAPWKAETVEEIDDYLHRRHKDISYNVTRVYGRFDMWLATELMFHSALEMILDGSKVERAWNDIIALGDTRTGKSQTATQMAEWYRLGMITSPTGNISRSGLAMGTNSQNMTEPGAWPRNHRGAVIFDEVHNAVTAHENPFAWLQSARDQGYVSSMKMGGPKKVPAKCRLLSAGNWARSKRSTYRYDCEHLKHIFGSPEAISRCDFLIIVKGEPDIDFLEKVEQEWTQELARALVLRAWKLRPDDIDIPEECLRLAKEACEFWKAEFLSDSVPLFTSAEKVASLVRIAISIANLCFSHDPKDPMRTVVRPVHMQWAIDWLQHTWATNGYEDYCRAEMVKETVTRPLHAEKHLTITAKQDDPVSAEAFLSMFLEPFHLADLAPRLGLAQNEANKWLSKGLILHVFVKDRADNAYNAEYRLTRSGRVLVESILDVAIDHPEEFARRMSILRQWVDQGLIDLQPLEHHP